MAGLDIHILNMCKSFLSRSSCVQAFVFHALLQSGKGGRTGRIEVKEGGEVGPADPA